MTSTQTLTSFWPGYRPWSTHTSAITLNPILARPLTLTGPLTLNWPWILDVWRIPGRVRRESRCGRWWTLWESIRGSYDPSSPDPWSHHQSEAPARVTDQPVHGDESTQGSLWGKLWAYSAIFWANISYNWSERFILHNIQKSLLIDIYVTRACIDWHIPWIATRVCIGWRLLVPPLPWIPSLPPPVGRGRHGSPPTRQKPKQW